MHFIERENGKKNILLSFRTTFTLLIRLISKLVYCQQLRYSRVSRQILDQHFLFLFVILIAVFCTSHTRHSFFSTTTEGQFESLVQHLHIYVYIICGEGKKSEYRERETVVNARTGIFFVIIVLSLDLLVRVFFRTLDVSSSFPLSLSLAFRLAFLDHCQFFDTFSSLEFFFSFLRVLFSLSLSLARSPLTVDFLRVSE